MNSEVDGYGKRDDQSDIDRLLEDCRTLSPSGIERIARGWMTLVGAGWAENISDHKEGSSVGHDAWHEAERAALHVLETTNRAPAWDTLRNRILELTERHDSMVAWREEHGDSGHRAEDALLGAALALSARPGLDVAHETTLLAPMSKGLPWLASKS